MTENSERRVVSVIVVNESSVLSRITDLFSARGYNITSLTVAPIPESNYSRLTIVTSGSVRVIEQITKQLHKLIPVYRVYEHAIAVSDSLIGWLYGFAVVGLFLNVSWGYKLSWFPGVILLYHSFNFWFWTMNRRRDGNKLVSDTIRIGWSLANFITGVLAILIAWNAS